MTYFIQTHKQKQLLMKLLLMMFLNQSILQLYQTYKNLQEKVQAGLCIQLQNINISKYNPLAGSSYIKLLKELDHPRRGLINIRNFDDNECFKWSLVRYVNPADRNPARIAKADKFPVKIWDIKKKNNGKTNSIGITVFDCENKKKHPIFVSEKWCEEKDGDL